MADVVNRFHMLNSFQTALQLIYMQITWSICMLNVICHTEALLLNKSSFLNHEAVRLRHLRQKNEMPINISRKLLRLSDLDPDAGILNIH